MQNHDSTLHTPPKQTQKLPIQGFLEAQTGADHSRISLHSRHRSPLHSNRHRRSPTPYTHEVSTTTFNTPNTNSDTDDEQSDPRIRCPTPHLHMCNTYTTESNNDTQRQTPGLPQHSQDEDPLTAENQTKSLHDINTYHLPSEKLPLTPPKNTQ